LDATLHLLNDLLTHVLGLDSPQAAIFQDAMEGLTADGGGSYPLPIVVEN
jgi:hypothetical protein